MTGPLLVLAVPAALAGFGFFAHRSSCPRRMWNTRGNLVPILATSAMFLGVIAAFLLYRNRETDPISVALFRQRFYFDEIYAWLIGGTQDLLAKISAFLDRWIHRCGRRARRERRDLGVRRAPATAPVRQPAGLRVPLRPRASSADLLHRLPMILLFIVFCPLVAAWIDPRRAARAFDRAVVRRPDLARHRGRIFSASIRARRGFSYVTSLPLSAEWRLSFALGLDGLSLIMVLLTALVTLAAVWFTGKIDRARARLLRLPAASLRPARWARLLRSTCSSSTPSTSWR